MEITVVQRGLGPTTDLFAWVMGDIDEELRAGAPADTILKLYNGAGTSSYEVMPALASLEAVVPGPHKTLTLMGWSAGGRGVQRMLDEALYRGGRVPDAVLVADGLYAPLVAGKADKRSLRSIIDYATRAALGKAVCVLWHSAIPTPYASSRQCVDAVLEEVERNVGAKLEQWSHPKLDGRFVKEALRRQGLHVIRYAGNGKAEHVAEARMVDEVMRALIPWATDGNTAGTIPPPPDTMPAWRDPCRTLGERCVAWSEAQLAAGLGEEPRGSNTGTYVIGLLAPCVRDQPDGTRAELKLRKAYWCAAAACAAEEASRLPGDAPSTPYRCSGIELERDFTAAGLFHTAAELRAGAYIPRVGDIVLLRRGTEDWGRHVCRVQGLLVGIRGVKTIGGNEADAWGHAEHLFADADFVGIGELPQGQHATCGAPGTTEEPKRLLGTAELDGLVALALRRLQDLAADGAADARPA